MNTDAGVYSGNRKRDSPLPPRDGWEDGFSTDNLPPGPPPTFSWLGWHGIGMGGPRTPRPQTLPLHQSLAEKGKREAGTEGSHLSPPSLSSN